MIPPSLRELGTEVVVPELFPLEVIIAPPPSETVVVVLPEFPDGTVEVVVDCGSDVVVVGAIVVVVVVGATSTLPDSVHSLPALFTVVTSICALELVDEFHLKAITHFPLPSQVLFVMVVHCCELCPSFQ